jgi:hypothetical protein
VRKYYSDSQCFKKKTTKLNCQLVQYWKNKINKENLKKKQRKKKKTILGKKQKKIERKKHVGKATVLSLRVLKY